MFVCASASMRVSENMGARVRVYFCFCACYCKCESVSGCVCVGFRRIERKTLYEKSSVEKSKLNWRKSRRARERSEKKERKREREGELVR